MKIFFCISFLLISMIPIGVQAQNQNAQDDIVIKAMNDELKRNMSELRLPDYERPFFMMYGVLDQKNTLISASLGALIQSNENHSRVRSTSRVLVGNYDFNDESLEDNHTTPSAANDIDLPLEDDYFGIRRSFWSITDKVYRSAARNLEKNKQSLAESGKKLEEIPHRSFAKANAVTLFLPVNEIIIDRKLWEDRVKELSLLFEKHSSILHSEVSFNFSSGKRYLVNSEGTMVRVPFSLASIRALAYLKDDNGQQSINGVFHMAFEPSKLPSMPELTQEINGLIKSLEEQSKLARLTEDYAGPVLFLGRPAAEVMGAALLGTEGVMANDQIPKLKGLQMDNEFSSERKMNKNVVSEMISVTAKPQLKSFEGVDLLGSFEIDNEGIVPESNVVLIQKGVLKNLLNNRTLTNTSQKANGYSSGPGVLQVEFSRTETEKSLRKKLIDLGRKQKLEYVFIVKDNGDGGAAAYYKVNVKDGTEEIVRGLRLEKFSLKNLKQGVVASNKFSAFNFGSAQSSLMSFIVPSGILFDGIEIGRTRVSIVKDQDYVSSPLK